MGIASNVLVNRHVRGFKNHIRKKGKRGELCSADGRWRCRQPQPQLWDGHTDTAEPRGGEADPRGRGGPVPTSWPAPGLPRNSTYTRGHALWAPFRGALPAHRGVRKAPEEGLVHL